MPRPQSQSALRAPLNEILGTEANVRLLRTLTVAGTSLGAGELARRAELGRTGVYPVLAALERAGIIELVGAGSSRQVRLRKTHPLAAPIAALFRAEEARVDSLVSELRAVLADVGPAVTSAWLTEPPRGRQADDPDTLSCYIVADTRSLPKIVDHVEDRLTAIERAFQVHIEVIGLSRSEVPVRVAIESLDEALLLAGIPPTALVEDVSRVRSSRNLRMHRQHDTGARMLAVAIAAKIRRDPSIVRRARTHISARMDKASEQEGRELKEWLRILSTMPTAKLQQFLVSGSERAVRLRQSLPALGLLTSAERRAVVEADSEAEALAALERAR
ncbi:MAG: hypothetical protein JWM41_921 [Gemmatimonadetes bacterium]|nr:hypothetical protein [Gemmatimonadota bacterium]